MSVTMNTLQALDQYLTTYGSNDSSNSNRKYNKRSSRFVMHDSSELQNLYSTIQWKNRFAPLYLTDPTPRSIAYAIHLKESANSLKQTIDSLSDDDDLFSMKSAYSDNESLASVEYEPDDAEGEVPTDFTLEVENFASPQVNTSKYLKANQPVSLEPGSYSFDLNMNSNSYEFQYNINVGDTNEEVLQKLARLVNNAHIGLKADMLSGSQEMAALRLESNQTGLAPDESSLFRIVPENTHESRQAMQILGIDAVAAMAENSSFLLNGTPHSSYSNTFTINNVFSITLNDVTPANQPVKIGFKPGAEAVTDDIQSLVDSFNSMIRIAEHHSGMPASNEKLLKDMGNVAKTFSSSLDPIGLSVSDKGMIDVDRTKLTQSVVSEEADQNIGVLNRFKDAIGRKADEASLDPMNYVKKILVTYKNPISDKNLVCPYISSIYSGMMVDRIC